MGTQKARALGCLVAGVWLAFTAFAMHAHAQDDHGDTPETATDLSLGSPADGLLERNDVDYFRFTIETAAEVEVWVERDLGSVQVSLLDASGTRLAEMRSRRFPIMARAPSIARIQTELSASTYFVEVSAPQPGEYRVAAALYVDDHGDTPETAADVHFGSPAEGELGTNDVDYFRLTVETPVDALLWVGGDRQVDARLLDSETNPVSDGGDQPGVFRVQRRLDTGTYYIEARASDRTCVLSGLSCATGGYEIEAVLYEDDHGDTPESATDLELGTDMQGVLVADEDLDYFRLTVEEPVELVVWTEGRTDTRGRILDSEGNEIATNDGDGDGAVGNFRIQRTLPAGTYRIEVGWEGVGSGVYRIATAPYEDDHGDTPETATDMPLGGRVEGFLGVGDRDFFRLALDASSVVDVLVTTNWRQPANPSRTAVLPSIRLLDEFGNELARRRQNYAGGTNWTQVVLTPWRPLDPGTYYVETWGGADDRAGAYDIAVVGGPVEADEHGDGPDDATDLALGGGWLGGEGSMYDLDYFRLRLAEPADVVLRVHYDEFLTRGLVDSDGALIWDRSGYEEDLFRHELAAGTYYLVPRPSRLRRGRPYVVAANVHSDDHGDAADAATDLTLGTSMEGEVVQGDVDYFRLAVDAEATVVAWIEAGRLGGRIRLLDSEGIELASDGGDRRPDLDVPWTLAPGTYYLAVRSVSSYGYAYTVATATVVQGDPGDTREDAIDLPLDGRHLAGGIDAGDVDYHQLSVAERTEVVVWTEGPTDTKARLLDATGRELIADDDGGSSGNFRVQRVLDAGTYFVEIRGESTGTSGPYAVAAEPYEDDHGDSMEDATFLPLGTRVAAEMGHGDSDHFRLDVRASTGVVIVTNGAAGAPHRLLDSDGTLVSPSDHTEPRRSNRTSVYRELEAGVYYLDVTEDGRGGRYGLVAAPFHSHGSDALDDHGDTRAAATDLKFGSSVAGQLDADDLDYFRLTVEERSAVAAWTEGDTDTAGRLLDADGVALALDDDSGEGVNFRIARALDPGTYYLEVAGVGRTDRDIPRRRERAARHRSPGRGAEERGRTRIGEGGRCAYHGGGHGDADLP